MKAEPDTRPFSSAELAHFLEQFELDRPRAPSAVLAARAPRIVGSEPRTILGMGGLPAAAADASPTHAPWRAPQCSEQRPASALFVSRSRVELACAALAAMALLVAALWLAALVAGPPVASSTTARPRARRVPPPLPLVLAMPAGGAPFAAAAPAATRAGTTSLAPQGAQPVALPERIVAAADLEAAQRAARPTAQTLRSAPRVAAPLGRDAARREAVDLLMAGHTRAALAVYRELPPALRAEPALSAAIRLLERELRDCEGLASSACGS